MSESAPEISPADLSLLTRHWALPVSASSPVAYRGGLPIARSTFYRDILAARHALTGVAFGEINGRFAFALFDADAYRFAVWLLAGWSLGLTVVLPSDELPVTREQLSIPWIGGESETNGDAHEWELHAAPRENYGVPGVILFTSGSTGQSTLIEKGLEQLRRETEMLAQMFGKSLTAETRFVASVPHQHMYGLPFFLLWPLMGAYPFVVEKLRYPEDLERLPKADYALVSAPTFLKHLPEGAAQAHGARWRMATSAGSPLALEIAQRAIAYLQAPVFEIYGSTETGAALYRQGNAPWQPLPSVRLSVDEHTSRLRIASPLLPEAEQKEGFSGFLSGDLARMDEQGLQLMGRADRLVKIGEKRISLAQIEQELSRLPGVAEARVISLPHALPHERDNDRVLLGAALILTEQGNARLEREGKARFDLSLRDALRDRLDPLAFPRRWRYLESYPTNDMGKVRQRDLEWLFAPLLPRVTTLSDSAIESAIESGKAADTGKLRKLVLRLDVPPNLVWFDGHFPGLPILPGVVQLDWVAHYARLYLGLDFAITRFPSLKFQHVIRPGDSLRLELVWQKEKRTLEFAFLLGERICSRATLTVMKPQ